MKRIYAAVLLTASLIFAVSCGNGNKNKTADTEGEAAAEVTEATAEVNEPEETPVEIESFFNNDFNVKYKIYGYDIAADYTSATRNENKDSNWDVQKKGDTMTCIEESYLIGVGRQTITTVLKADGDNVEVTTTTVYSDPKLQQINELGGNDKRTRVKENSDINKAAEEWFYSEKQKGIFNYGSKNPQYDQEGMEVTVSKGPKMFGRATKEYKAKVEKGSLMDMAGYKLETRAIFDAQRIGMEYFRYQAFLKLANTDEFMTYEVTELEILDK